MVSILKIINEDNNNSVPFNEIAILKVIKSLEGRNKPLQEYFIHIWETLEGKRFNKKQLQLI